jgi:uncharacterized protein (TIGR04255 family)
MPFPKVQRVIYQRNPLERVICQLRFPPILRIESTVPADFQDRIRGDFPRFREKIDSPSAVQLPSEMADQLPEETVIRMIQGVSKKNYEFLSQDGSWQVNLTRTFLALTAFRYERWEEFQAKLRDPLEALVEIYSPAHYSRIGLRYIDVIQRSSLGLGDMSWTELLQPHMIGALITPHLGAEIEEFQARHQIRLSDGQSRVRIVAGLAQCADDEVCFRIDSDFFNTNDTPLQSAEKRLGFLRKRGSRLFRWAIKDRLHQAMEPRELC